MFFGPYTYDMAELQIARQQYIANEAALEPCRTIIGNGNYTLQFDPPTVGNKTKLLPDGLGGFYDNNYYVSQHRFYWRNPNTADGYPYVYRDGENNPEAAEWTDKANLENLTRHLPKLAKAYYVSLNLTYAEKAVAMLRAWFLDPKTKMLPTMEHALFIPGRNSGSYSGIMESRHFIVVLDAIVLLLPSQLLTSTDVTALASWHSRLLYWLTTSPFGKQEALAPNNHSTWYDAQRVKIALALGRTVTAKRIVTDTPSRLLEKQVAIDGSQPNELTRTDGFDYSIFNIQAFIHLAQAGDALRINLWNASEGRLRKAMDFLLPYIHSPATWPYSQRSAIYWPAVKEVLKAFYQATGDDRYLQALAAVP